MTISELIAELEAFKADHGDLDVETMNIFRERQPLGGPELAYRKVLSSRERKPDFWSDWSSRDVGKKGDPVCKL